MSFVRLGNVEFEGYVVGEGVFGIWYVTKMGQGINQKKACSEGCRSQWEKIWKK